MAKDQTEGKKTKADKIALLEEKRKKIQDQITKLKTAQSSKTRKEETRKKIVLGGWFLSLVEKDPKVKELYNLFLEKGVSDRDKKLFE